MADFRALDLFSKQADVYAKFRPRYPQEIFEFLKKNCKEYELAWDVGTGNGQAAVQLSTFFRQVVATDISSNQIAHAEKKDNVRYLVTPGVISAEVATELIGPPGTVDLVTIAQALHWFEFESFYSAVRTVLKPDGIIAAWTYQLPSISPEMDNMMKEYYSYTGPYWEFQRTYVDSEYRTIPFDFKPLTGFDSVGPIEFFMTKEGTLGDLIGYFESWSPFQKAKDKGLDLLADFRGRLKEAWGDQAVRVLTWKTSLIVGAK